MYFENLNFLLEVLNSEWELNIDLFFPIPPAPPFLFFVDFIKFSHQYEMALLGWNLHWD